MLTELNDDFSSSPSAETFPDDSKDNEDPIEENPFTIKSESKSKVKSKTPVLDNFGRDLTSLAIAGKLDPVIGREKEIERVSQILSRRNHGFRSTGTMASSLMLICVALLLADSDDYLELKLQVGLQFGSIGCCSVRHSAWENPFPICVCDVSSIPYPKRERLVSRGLVCLNFFLVEY